MNWKEVTAPPPVRMLRQFGLLSLAIFGGWGAWSALAGRGGLSAVLLLAIGMTFGILGWARPQALRPIFTGWMIVAFPIGWVVSRVVLGAMFYLLFTLVALVFRTIGRDALQLKRKPPSAESYWEDVASGDARSYFRQF